MEPIRQWSQTTPCTNQIDQLRIKLDEIKGHPLYSINQGLFFFPAQSEITIKMEIHTGSP